MTLDDASDARSVRRVLRLAAALVMVVTAALLAPPPAGADEGSEVVPGTTTVSTIAARGDVYRYLTYVPTSYRDDSDVPLVVMVHGCQTTAEKEQEITQLDRVADREGFVVLYPDVGEHGRTAPGPLKNCWNFVEPISVHRDRGDAAVIARMTRTVAAELAVDPERIYLVGISAGGLMTSISAAAYPDLYAAVGIASSSAYGDWTCLGNGIGVPTFLSAQNAYREMGPRARVVPTFVIGGDADLAFSSSCQRKALEQGLRTNNLVLSGTSQDRPLSLRPTSTVKDQVPGGHAYTVQRYTDAGGCLVAERWNVHGMGHYWSGGTDDVKGPEGAEAVWSFLERYTRSGTGGSCAEGRQL